MNRYAKLVRLVGIALLCLAAAAPTRATLLSAGSPLTFNLDFTTSVPLFNAAEVLANWSPGLLPGQQFEIDFFDAFDAIGFILGGGIIGGGSTHQDLRGSSPGIADGIFSIQLSLNFGSVDVTSLVVNLGNLDIQTFVFTPLGVSQTLIPSSAPEPGTLALIAVSLAAFGFLRTRRDADRAREH